MAAKLEPWNILVVDDEDDIHEVTKLALKRKTWRNRPMNLVSAKSGKEAVKVLASHPTGFFQTGLIDVVMETEDAGLNVCKYIRTNCPRTLRIIVRTGQPGVAPPDKVLNEYDIDYYLAKPEVTVERLYSVVRACLRSSQDIATLLAFGKQVQNFLASLKNVSSIRDLLVFMTEGLRFLELKHQVRVICVYDIAAATPTGLSTPSGGPDVKTLRDAVARVHERGAREALLPGKDFGLSETSFVMPFTATAGGNAAKGGLYIETEDGTFPASSTEEVRSDTKTFVDNWKAAYSTLPSGKWWRDD